MKEKLKKVFNGRLIKLSKGNKVLPDGREAYFEQVDHPGAALVVPFFKGKIVFVYQYRAVIRRHILELPAGTLEAGETPYACAKREVGEETGYVATDIKKLGVIFTTPGFCTEKIHIYKANCTCRKKQTLDKDEVIKVKILSKSEIKDAFKKGRINDAKTISALTYAGVL